jgi:tRNA (guanine37-N1)-methyltransferase
MASNSYKDIVNIPNELKENLPNSYDVIGDIILIKLTDELQKFKKEIGKSLISAHKNIKTICLVEPVSGEFRKRKIEIIAGEKNTITIHREYGLNFHVDVEKTYFSPRLANERLRIAKQVKKGETIVDMFTGVAPFSIMIAKKSNPKLIYAVDKNKHAIKLAKKNVTTNNLLDKIEVLVGDSKKIKSIIGEKTVVNRIIMNNPTMSIEFFKHALEIVIKKTIIHYYEILPENKVDERIEILKDIAEKKKIMLEKVEINKLKSYSPSDFYICFDITAKKN